MNRRALLKGGAATLSGMLLANSSFARRKRSKLKHFVFVKLGGGPSQMELWDPKPGTKNGGETKGIKTKIAGVQFADSMPGMAEYSNNMAVIRTSSRIGEHMLGTYYVGSGGFGPSPVLKHPGMVSVVGWRLANENNDLPPVVSLGGSMSAGFLGNSYDPYVAGNSEITLEIASQYKQSVEQADQMRKEYYKVSPLGQADDFHEEIKHESRSSRLSLGISNKVFDLSTESTATQEAYGGRGFGNSCLTARRLIMAGVPAVHLSLGGWDNHNGIFDGIGDRVGRLDKGISQLVKELKALGLFDKTMIMIAGEFGRTPNINNNQGRDHYPRNTPVALISGAIKKGIAIGNSGPDGTGMENMVTLGAVSHSVYKMMGISPTGQFTDKSGRPLRYCPSDAGLQGLV